MRPSFLVTFDDGGFLQLIAPPCLLCSYILTAEEDKKDTSAMQNVKSWVSLNGPDGVGRPLPRPRQRRELN